MPIQPVLGPAGGGKTQWIAERQKPNDVVIDFSYLYRGAERYRPEADAACR